MFSFKYFLYVSLFSLGVIPLILSRRNRQIIFKKSYFKLFIFTFASSKKTNSQLHQILPTAFSFLSTQSNKGKLWKFAKAVLWVFISGGSSAEMRETQTSNGNMNHLNKEETNCGVSESFSVQKHIKERNDEVQECQNEKHPLEISR